MTPVPVPAGFIVSQPVRLIVNAHELVAMAEAASIAVLIPADGASTWPVELIALDLGRGTDFCSVPLMRGTAARDEGMGWTRRRFSSDCGRLGR